MTYIWRILLLDRSTIATLIYIYLWILLHSHSKSSTMVCQILKLHTLRWTMLCLKKEEEIHLGSHLHWMLGGWLPAGWAAACPCLRGSYYLWSGRAWCLVANWPDWPSCLLAIEESPWLKENTVRKTELVRVLKRSCKINLDLSQHDLVFPINLS